MNLLTTEETINDSNILRVLSTEEMKASGEDDSDIWHLRKEHRDASKALRSRKISHDNYKVPNSDTLSRPVEDIASMKTTEEVPSRQRRPGFVHRKTDPCPMREFVRHNWNKEETIGGDLTEDVDDAKHETTCEQHEDVDMTADSEVNVLDEEPLLISSYQLAKRRLSLPVATLSTLEQTWSNRNTMFDDSDDTDNVSLDMPVKHQHRPSCIKQLQHSPSMERRRRQSAWTRARSLNVEETSKSKRRMSELPALSTLATRRRSAPHTLSIAPGLRRKTSRSGISSDHLNSSCLKAKNEMLATLSLTSWSENLSRKHHEMSRRKTCHTGFGIMALKKKEEKRLMVAQEILQTEKNYIKALETLNEVFTEPLKNSCVIPEKDIRTMFPKQLDAMKSGHEKFMNELDERLNKWNCEGILGDIFTRLGNSYHIDFMNLYSEYVNNFPKSIAVINKYTRNSHKFKRFLEKCDNDPRCERLTISAFLLTPIQRLPRYVLLLRQLAKYTDPNHPDSFHIGISLEKMIDIINILNSSIQSSTKVVRNTSLRRSSRRRRKRHIFKAKETPSSNLTSPRKSSDDSECSEASTQSTPHDLSPLTINITSPDQKSSDYGSLTPSETPPEPRSPSPTSGSSSTRSSFLKVILRNGSEAKRRKRRPLSTTEVEIRRNDCSQTHSKDALKRSASRDSVGSMIRHKFGTLRRRPRSSEENFDKNLSLEKLNDSHIRSFKYLRPASPEEDSFNEMNECSKSDSDFVKGKKPDGRNSCSSIESCTGSREHIPLTRKRSPLTHEHSPLAREHSPLARQHSPLTHEHSPLAREHSSLSCDHSDSDDSTTQHDSRRTLDKQRRLLGIDTTEEQFPRRKKLGKRNSFTNAVKHFFVSKSRSSSPETVLDCSSMTNRQDQLYNSDFTKEKISTLTTV